MVVTTRSKQSSPTSSPVTSPRTSSSPRAAVAGDSNHAHNNNAKSDVTVTGDAAAASGSKAFDHKMLAVVFVALVIDLLAFTMILPLLPALLDHYGQNEQDGVYSSLKSLVTDFRVMVGAPDTPRWNSVLFGGVIGSLFSLLQFLSSPLLGAASDVYGRRPVMLLSMCGVALSYVLWYFSSSFTIFVLARIVGGVSKGNVSLSTAVVADITPQEKRSSGMAAIGIAFSVGFLIGPMIGAFFSRQARDHVISNLYSAPALFAIVLACCDIVFLLLFFRETLPREKRAKSISNNLQGALYLINPKSLFQFSAVRGASEKDLSAMRRVGLVYFLYLFLYSGLEFTLTFLTYTKFEFDSMQQGKMFFLIGTVMVLVQGGFARRIKPGKEIRTATMGLAVICPSFLIVGLANQVSVLYLGLVLYAFASATVVPCLTTVISSYGTVDQKGTVLGIFRSLGALARAGGPLFASTIYWSFGVVACYTFGAAALLLPLVLLQRSKLRLKQE